MLEQCCNHLNQYRTNGATLCCLLSSLAYPYFELNKIEYANPCKNSKKLNKLNDFAPFLLIPGEFWSTVNPLFKHIYAGLLLQF